MYSKIFNSPVESRLESWLNLRRHIENSDCPLDDLWEFWRQAPFVPYNKEVDPFNRKSWPNPWAIITNNLYDEFTRALMMGWTLKLTNRYKDSKIEIRTLVDNTKTSYYNVVYIDDEWVINYSDNGPIQSKSMPISFYLENLVELETPR